MFKNFFKLSTIINLIYTIKLTYIILCFIKFNFSYIILIFFLVIIIIRFFTIPMKILILELVYNNVLVMLY